MAYLNTYRIWQSFGGPEEGGWWYESGTPVQSLYLNQQTAEDYIQDKEWEDLKELYEKTTETYIQNSEDIYANENGYHFAPGSDEPSIYIKANEYSTIIEDHYAEDYPSVKPHYE